MIKINKIFLILLISLSASLGLAETTALVIIDMQPKFATRGGYQDSGENPHKLQMVLERQVHLIEKAISDGLPILVVEYTAYGTTNETLLKAIGDYKNVRTFIKSSNGMFDAYSGVANEIKDYLDSKEVSHLVIAGANGGACVRCSIYGALQKGYEVWADGDAIIDLNFEDFIFPYHYKEGNLSLETNRMKFHQPNVETEINQVFNESAHWNGRGIEASQVVSHSVNICSGLF